MDLRPLNFASIMPFRSYRLKSVLVPSCSLELVNPSLLARVNAFCQQLLCIVPALTGGFQFDSRIHTKRYTLLLSVKSVSKPPPLSTLRSYLDIQTVSIAQSAILRIIRPSVADSGVIQFHEIDSMIPANLWVTLLLIFMLPIKLPLNALYVNGLL